MTADNHSDIFGFTLEQIEANNTPEEANESWTSHSGKGTICWTELHSISKTSRVITAKI